MCAYARRTYVVGAVVEVGDAKGSVRIMVVETDAAAAGVGYGAIGGTGIAAGRSARLVGMGAASAGADVVRTIIAVVGTCEPVGFPIVIT